MSDELNPYASPRTPAEARAATLRAPVRPWLTRLLTVGLILNVLSIPVAIGMEEVSDRLRFGGFRLLGNAVEFASHAVSFWVFVAWPIVSLFTAIYTPVVDHDTRWWRTKTSIAAVMLLLWIAGCATFFWIGSHWELGRAVAVECERPVRLAHSIRASGMTRPIPPFIGEWSRPAKMNQCRRG